MYGLKWASSTNDCVYVWMIDRAYFHTFLLLFYFRAQFTLKWLQTYCFCINYPWMSLILCIYLTRFFRLPASLSLPSSSLSCYLHIFLRFMNAYTHTNNNVHWIMKIFIFYSLDIGSICAIANFFCSFALSLQKKRLLYT